MNQIIIDKFQAIFFDLDGVVWLGDTVVPGAADALARIRAAGKVVRFVTNNASQYRTRYIEKLAGMGIVAELEEVFTSGYATARYLANRFGSSAVYVMGSENLKREMKEAGHEIIEGKPDEGVGTTQDAKNQLTQCQFVVVGYDRRFNWDILDQAYYHIYHGAQFVACNTDHVYPEELRPRPGTGCQVAALACCAGRQPDIIVGKPNLPIMEMALASTGLAAADCLMVGDKIETDILGGAAVGMATALVLSGTGDPEDSERFGVKPDYIISSIADL